MAFFGLGWRTLWRDLRAGELTLLIVAVTLAVGAVTAVGFFADRLQGGLQRDASQLLGGDAVIVSDNPTPAAIVEKIRSTGLRAVSTVTFPTMARAPDAQGGAVKLVALKAVEPGYPLRGTLRIALDPKGPDISTRAVPAAGTVWVDAGVLDALGLQLGGTLWLGTMQFQITHVLVTEPDRGVGFMNFSPRVMMNHADIAATGLVQPASRVTYRMAVAGDAASVKDFVVWVTAWIQGASTPSVRGVRLESLQSGQPQMNQTLERAGQFLSLVALLCALLSAVAVALAARAFAASHLDDCAMLRVLGVRQRTIAASYCVEFALVGLAASGLGVLLGYAVHEVLVLLMQGLLQVALPVPTAWPAVMGVGMGFTLLIAFGLPPVLQLAQVPALRVIRRDMGPTRVASVGVLVLGVLGFAALLLSGSHHWRLGLITVGGFGGAVVFFSVASWLLIKLLRRSVNERTAPRWLLLATRQIAARPAYTVLQVNALALGLLALVLLVVLRTDLITSWRQTISPDAPNRFVINIMPEQVADFERALRGAGLREFGLYPMIRGRLIAINGRNVSAQDYSQDRAKRLLEREFNISHRATKPEHNEVVAGRWLQEEAGAVSVEQGIATTLGLQLGDMLRFDMGGVQVNARITSLRKVDWGSMRANFFILYPLSRFDDVPHTFMSTFKAPLQGDLEHLLVRQFPNVSSVDLSSTLQQVQRVLDQVIRAVEFLFGFTLLAGIVVLFAALNATREARTREFAIMRALGASSRMLQQVQRAELLGVGLLAGGLAGSVALGVSWALARYVFDFAWSMSFSVPMLSAVVGAVLAWLAGWWSLRDVVRKPVAHTLRRAIM